MLIHYSFYPWKEEEARLKRIRVGMSEQQVLTILGGQPTWTFTAKDNKDYYMYRNFYKNAVTARFGMMEYWNVGMMG